MPAPTTSTYFGVPGYLFLWLFTLLSFSLFGYRVFHYVRVLKRARPENRWDQPIKRVWLFLTHVLGQRRLFNEPVIGIAHLLIFWAFIFYATSFFWNLLKGLLPFTPIPYADEVPWMAFALEILGVLALVSLLVAAVRRYVFTPPHLKLSWDATLILCLIAILLLSFLGGQGFKALGEGHRSSWMPVGTFIAQIFTALGVSPVQAPSLFLWAWWIHMVTVLGFLAYLPYSKHLHLLASPFGVLFASLSRGRMPAGSEGASQLEEFTWRQLLNGLTCAECGRCDRACPAFNSGFPLSPQRMVHHIKELVRAAPVLTSGLATGNESHSGKKFLGEVVRPEELWACMTCYACMERCPVFNEHIPLIVQMRRHLVSQGQVDQRLQETLVNLTRYGNSFGQSDRARARWTQGLPFKIKDARREPVEYLWFVGDYASYDPRAQEITRTVSMLFHEAGLDFGILYESERNAGNDVRRVGEEGLFELLVEKNIATLKRCTFGTIVTTDPHTYNTLKNEYPDFGASYPVMHYTELLWRLIQERRLPLRAKVTTRVTYHDPCYLGRYNGVYEEPRRVLRALGVELVEMPRNRDRALCCAAGGGRIWMEDCLGIRERPSESRVREAAALTGVSTLVVACPKDLVMFLDAVKTTGYEGKIAVQDLVQLVAEAVQPGSLCKEEPTRVLAAKAA
ncbi:MAG: (Fe-S)-binding protein [Anaerolineae bacterium]|nr:heterodisulfide reductase-related iron-sulfur binding cluster [Anaerolineae bacterium]MDW8097972.1 (Fe-S)-binding protein [Anaerolineae bacterium]